MGSQKDIDRHAGARWAQHAVPLQRIRSRFADSLVFSKAADFGVAGLDNLVDEIYALVVRQKGALHGIDGDFFEVIERQTKGVRGGLEFLGHGRVAHQAVVGV